MKLVGFALLLVACTGPGSANDAGADVVGDVELVLPSGDAASACDAAQATLPSGPSNCAPCPSSVPAEGESCDAGGLTCQYGSDPRLGCNPVYACDGVKWSAEQLSTTGGCGTVYQCGGEPTCSGALCVGDGGVCVGTLCQPFLAIAPGCPCTPADHAHIALCGGGSFDLVCSDAGRFDGVIKDGLCGE